jgi:hypothetical protein
MHDHEGARAWVPARACHDSAFLPMRVTAGLLSTAVSHTRRTRLGARPARHAPTGAGSRT